MKIERLAIQIADDDCRVVIDSYGAPAPRGWKEMFPRDRTSGFYVRRALRYLEMRGLLIRHPKFPNRVKVRP